MNKAVKDIIIIPAFCLLIAIGAFFSIRTTPIYTVQQVYVGDESMWYVVNSFTTEFPDTLKNEFDYKYIITK